MLYVDYEIIRAKLSIEAEIRNIFHNDAVDLVILPKKIPFTEWRQSDTYADKSGKPLAAIEWSIAEWVTGVTACSMEIQLPYDLTVRLFDLEAKIFGRYIDAYAALCYTTECLALLLPKHIKTAILKLGVNYIKIQFGQLIP